MRQRALPVKRWYLRRGPQIVFEKLDVPLKLPVDLRRGSHPVVQAEGLSMLVAWWTRPSLSLALVAVRIPLRQPFQLIVGLALFPPGAVLANHEEVRRMQNAQALTIRCTIIELDGGNLIVVLQNGLIVLQFDDGGKLDTVAFKLNRDAHLFAGIPSGDVRAAAANASRWFGTPNARYR